jgi:hypothetical protein
MAAQRALRKLATKRLDIGPLIGSDEPFIDGRIVMSNTLRMSLLAATTLVASTFAGSVQAQQSDMSFFITSAGPGKGGDLGGLEGADRHCQQLATAAGAGGKTWRAYLSTSGMTPVNARDRIGAGPWKNAKGVVIATSVDDLHGDGNKINKETGLDEKGNPVKARGETPNMHDMLTGSQLDGRAFPGNMNLTCNNWTSSTFGSAMLGHHDRQGIADTIYQKSWNSSHMSRSCAQPDLVATGGNGLFYCFAAN